MQVNETLQHGQLDLLCRTQLLDHLRPADRRGYNLHSMLLFCFIFLLLWAQPCLFTFYWGRAEKGFACSMHASLVCDITDVNWQAQNGSTHSHVPMTFSC